MPRHLCSRELFTSQNRKVSVTIVWAMEVEPGRRFTRAGPGGLFRVEFDLSRPVPAPPTPWGW